MNTDEFVDVRVLPWSTPVDVIRARYTTFEFPTHAHAEFTIGEVLQGSELFAHLGRQVEAPTGSFFHLNPAEAHNGRAGRGSWTYVSIYPGVEFLRRSLPELFIGGEPWFASPVSRRPELSGRIASFVRRVFEGYDDLVLESDLILVLRDLMQPPRGVVAATGRSGASAAVAMIRGRLADEWDRNLTLSELAATASMTPLTLLRLFREQVGCTPQVFRTARRLEVARRLMRDGDALSTIAVRCGFTDQSHFSNTFRKWTGMTPGHYRSAARTARHAD